MPETKFGMMVCQWLKNGGDKSLILNLSHFQHVLQVNILIIKLWPYSCTQNPMKTFNMEKMQIQVSRNPCKQVFFMMAEYCLQNHLATESVLSAIKMCTVIASYNTIMILLPGDAPDITQECLIKPYHLHFSLCFDQQANDLWTSYKATQLVLLWATEQQEWIGNSKHLNEINYLCWMQSFFFRLQSSGLWHCVVL